MDGQADDKPARRRDATATKEAILRSAVVAFTRHGYDGIGVREIAQDAGVSAMLVPRYFGSKEGLFAEACDAAFAPRTVIPDSPLPDSRAGLAQALAQRLVERTARGSDELDPFLLMLRSAGNPRAAEIMAGAIARHPGRALAELLEEDSDGSADGRALLASSLIAGVWLMRKLLVLPALAEADDAELTRRIRGALEALLGTVDAPGRVDRPTLEL
jgi:AcrR family transcriptional regulator